MRQILHISKGYETMQRKITNINRKRKRKLKRNYSYPEAFKGHQLLDNASDISPPSQAADSLVWQKSL